MKFFTAILSALAIAVSTTTATPINARADLIVNLPISNPKEGEMWHPGTTQTVTWDPSGVPPQDNHYTGTIYLGYWSGHNQDEHLDLDHPLASGFRLMKGSQNVIVPHVKHRTTYFVVVMGEHGLGDSGNRSGNFTILGD